MHIQEFIPSHIQLKMQSRALHIERHSFAIIGSVLLLSVVIVLFPFRIF